MKLFHSRHLLRPALLAALVASLSANCLAASAMETISASLAETNSEIVRTGNNVQAAVKSLNTLTAQETGDLRPNYQQYVAALTATEESAKSTAAEAAKLRDNMTTFFAGWQNELGRINNPGVKSNAEKRFNNVQKNYSALAGNMAAVAEQFRPLLSDLTDIKVALSNDLTSGGVKSIKGMANGATRKMAALHDELSVLLGQISDTRKKLDSSTGN
jgi:hypothetical protein